MCGVLPNPILLPGQRTRLIQPGAAPQLRPRSNAGSLLCVRQGAAVPPGGGAEAGAAEQLRQCAWVPGAGVTAPALFAAPHIPYPIAAPPTSERGIKTAARGRAKRAAAALVPGFSKSFHRRHYAISDLSQNRANARAFQEEPVGNCARGAHLNTAAGDFSLSPLRSGERVGERGTNTVANDGWGGSPP